MIPVKYLQQSWFFFRSHLGMLCAIQIPFLICVGLIQVLLLPEQPNESQEGFSSAFFYYMLAAAAIMPLSKAALILYFSATLNNYQVTLGQVFAKALGYWTMLFAISMLASFGTVMGLIFLIVPGVIVGVRLSLAEYICIIEGLTTIESLKESWHRTSEHFWELLLGFGFLLLTINSIGMVFAGLVGEGAAGTLALELLVGMLSVLMTIFGFRFYNIIPSTTK